MLDLLPERKRDDLCAYASGHPQFRMFEPKAAVMDLAPASVFAHPPRHSSSTISYDMPPLPEIDPTPHRFQELKKRDGHDMSLVRSIIGLESDEVAYGR